MSAAATMMVAPAQAAVSSRNLSSSSSVAFNNGGVRSVNMVAPRRPMKSLGVRAREIEDDRNIIEKVQDAARDVSNAIQDKMPAGTQPGGVGRKPGDEWTQLSSTGELNPAKKEAAEKNNPDGLDVMQKLQDAGRTLKSKTNDVVQYGAHRNADDVPADAKEKNIKAQKEYTDSL